MKINKTYKSLLDKSINSMLSAIEIYNKPDFKYREETFSILSINAWELLFKARLLKVGNYKMNSIYQMEPKKLKNGEKSKRLQPKLNRAKNPMTISLADSILRLKGKGEQVSLNLVKSLFALIELRDNAIHFHNSSDISKEIQELGFACIKNYMELIKKWEPKTNLSQYNFYLMPLAYVDSTIESKAILTDEVTNYLNFLKKKVSETDNEDLNFSVAIGIDISFKKNATLDGIGMRYDADGIPVNLSEEDITKKFPLTYNKLTSTARNRYLDFKLNSNFHDIMRGIKKNKKLAYNRSLDPKNAKSQVKSFFNSNIWQELDKKYKKK
ncbi:DUF3644 domain-containing protein [Maribacter sp. ANRC-HE7]|uniref:DUF3644 domain-containing protein n=1 Tax=Maribacter aquimaris TaxID=2737171 RepID=A0ABR7V3B1_9FLAO|nr:DUF3644 domain-containing protein [Maribacter aquimaris]MBD0777633.1 DUF3644 domain-containing protein [Maribacter aquimaris]